MTGVQTCALPIFGARHQAEFAYSANPVNLNTLRQALATGQSDIVFLAVDAARARIVRPYLDGPLPVFATSQVLAARQDGAAELNGILGVVAVIQYNHSLEVV